MGTTSFLSQHELLDLYTCPARSNRVPLDPSASAYETLQEQNSMRTTSGLRLQKLLPDYNSGEVSKRVPLDPSASAYETLQEQKRRHDYLLMSQHPRMKRLRNRTT